MDAFTAAQRAFRRPEKRLRELVFYIQVIDSAENCVYDTFSASEQDLSLLFPNGTDIAFAEDLFARADSEMVKEALQRLWKNRVPKNETRGIHGTIFYGLEHKRAYYPTLKDEEARNPNGSKLRA